MRQLLVLTAVLATSGALVSGQVLGDVARREEERRKTVKAPGKVYTNDSLRPEPPPSSSAPATPAAAAPASSQSASLPEVAAETPGATAKSAADAPKDQKYWSTRMAEAHKALERSQMFQEALQSRINGLATDFVSRDDPAQQRQIAAERDKALAELDRVKEEVVQHTKAIANIQEEARRAGVPPGWLR